MAALAPYSPAGRDSGDGPAPGAPASGHGSGHALRVARALAHDPSDARELAAWAAQLHISAKTLQRDFQREFGMPYTRWRTRLRLSAARALLGTEPVTRIARRVGYASPSAFVAAFAKEYGQTPARTPGAGRAEAGVEAQTGRAAMSSPGRAAKGLWPPSVRRPPLGGVGRLRGSRWSRPPARTSRPSRPGRGPCPAKAPRCSRRRRSPRVSAPSAASPPAAWGVGLSPSRTPAAPRPETWLCDVGAVPNRRLGPRRTGGVSATG
ncbi:helix-turn-helix domain-containing protein [Streptomyces diastaticus]